MQTVLKIITLVAAILTVSCSLPEKPGKKPNIIFIMADDMGWADLPVYGNKFNEAPRLMQMAKEGIMFTNAYAASPVCSSTRASIQSGQYPSRVGIIDFIPGHWRPFEEVVVPKNKTQFLPDNIVTIGDAMKKAGYKTAYFGKWHLGSSENHHPLKRGYDISYEYKGGGYFNPKFKPGYNVNDPKQPLSDILSEMSVDFLAANKDTSFFLFLSHYDVHVQLNADSALIQKYLNKDKVEEYPCNAVYAAMIESIDKSVGKVLDKLKELGLDEETIVFFSSDNGGLVKRYDNGSLLDNSIRDIYKNDSLLYVSTSNAPLRGEKGTVYEGGIRVPLLVRWPGKITPGMVSDAPLISMDFYPTLVTLGQSYLPPKQKFDGINIMPQILGEPGDENRELFWHYPVYHHDVPKSVIRKGYWKLIENNVDGSVELYNLESDISETHNFAEEEVSTTRYMKTLLNQKRVETGARLPLKNENFNPERRFEWQRHPDL